MQQNPRLVIFFFYLQNLNIIHDTNNGLFPFPWFAYLERENDIRKKSRKGYISNSVTGIGKEKRLVHLAWLGVQQEVCFYKKKLQLDAPVFRCTVAIIILYLVYTVHKYTFQLLIIGKFLKIFVA